MKTAVIDTGVFVAGVFWRHEPHLVLKAWRRGILLPVLSEEIFSEYQMVLERVKQEQEFSTQTRPWLEALRTSALWVTLSPLGKRLCHDPKDDKFIAAALAAGSRAIIARDHHLTVLEKPFGIAMQTPRMWLGTLSRIERRRLV
jgi:putative PIN family toxin of toxin-antitoxin system